MFFPLEGDEFEPEPCKVRRGVEHGLEVLHGRMDKHHLQRLQAAEDGGARRPEREAGEFEHPKRLAWNAACG